MITINITKHLRRMQMNNLYLKYKFCAIFKIYKANLQATFDEIPDLGQNQNKLFNVITTKLICIF